jgi:hypothetical protein
MMPLSFIAAISNKISGLFGKRKPCRKDRRILFVCGAPRSGTTGLWRLLIQDPRIVLGMERHGSRLRRESFTPDLYDGSHFFDFETYPNVARIASSYYESEARNRFDSAEYVGDKLPLIYQSYRLATAVFPSAKFVVLLRNIFDICESYQARLQDTSDNWHFTVMDAVKHWNSLLVFLTQRGGDSRVKVLVYEQFLSDIRAYEDLYRFLGLAIDASFRARYARMMEDAERLTQRRSALVSDGQKYDVLRTAKLDLYAQQVRRFALPRAIPLISGR